MPKRRKNRVRKPPKDPLFLAWSAAVSEAIVSAILNRVSSHLQFWWVMAISAVPIMFLAAALWRNENGYGRWLQKQFNSHRWSYIVLLVVFLPTFVYSSGKLVSNLYAVFRATAPTTQLAAISPDPSAPLPVVKAATQTIPAPEPLKPKAKHKPPAHKKKDDPPPHVGFYVDKGNDDPCTPENAMHIQNATASSNLPPGSANVTGFEFHGHPCVDAKDLKTGGNIQKGYVFDDDKQKANPREKQQQ